jgi:diaminopropionate ammonia-lyase
VLWATRSGARDWTSEAELGVAYGFHVAMPGYAPTALVELPELAAELGVGSVLVKLEADRFGLPAFKILGASWAVNRELSRRSGFDAPAADLAELRRRADATPVTLVTATDGNHGHGVARMAALLGLPARVYLPAGTSPAVVAAIAAEGGAVFARGDDPPDPPLRRRPRWGSRLPGKRALPRLGATIIKTELIYDDVVRLAAESVSGKPDQVLVQDTAWPGYEDVPGWIVQGYDTLFGELDRQLGDRRPDLVAVPTGVGSLLQAALDHYRAPGLAHRPAILAVEPVTAACVTASLTAGEPVSVDTSAPTIMAGLNCGTVSTLAWPAIRNGLDAGIGVTEDETRAAMDRLRELGVIAGPSGAASLAGTAVAVADPDRRAALDVTGDSIVALLCTEAVRAA